MSSQPSRISDADLMAYFDHSLDATRTAEIEARLPGDQDAQDRLAEWRRQNALIASLYQPAAAEPLPSRFNVRHMAAKRGAIRQNWMQIAASALLCLSIGGAGGWYAGQRSAELHAGSTSVLIDDALVAHRLYSSELLHPVAVWGNPGNHLAIWLSKRLSHKLVIPDLTPAGWSLVGGSLLPAGTSPAAQIMYEDANGRRLTLFITSAGQVKDHSPRFASAGDLNALNWTDGGVTCTIVGAVDRDEMKQIAAEVYNQLT